MIFSLKRGVLVYGRITDAKTAEPLSRCGVEYVAFPNNPHGSSAPGYQGAYRFFSYETDQDGRYTIPVLPGRGILAVQAVWKGEERYPFGVGSEKIPELRTARGEFGSLPAKLHFMNKNVLTAINPADDAKELHLDLKLDPCQTLTGTVSGPDGKPLVGCHYCGISERGVWRNLDSETFTVNAYRPDHPRELSFVHLGQKLAGNLTIKGEQTAPITVRLQPWGIITGRIVDANGQPLSNLEIGGGLPTSLLLKRPNGEAYRVNESFLTNQDGRFRIEGLAPGVMYGLYATHKHTGELFFSKSLFNVMVEPGQTKDLGNVTAEPDIVRRSKKPKPTAKTSSSFSPKPAATATQTVHEKVLHRDNNPIADIQPAPIPVASDAGTTLHSILQRLAVEEKRYDSIEVVATTSCQSLNSKEKLAKDDITTFLSSVTRQRNVLLGDRSYHDEQCERKMAGGTTQSSHLRQAYDGQWSREYQQDHSTNAKWELDSLTCTGVVGVGPRNSSLLLRGHTMLFYDNYPPLSTTLASRGTTDQRAISVEYVGDERVGNLHCHKLKCTFPVPPTNNDDTTHFAFLWLARDRNLLPVRLAFYNPVRYQTRPQGISFVEELREIRSGQWFPFKTTHLTYQQNGGMKDNPPLLQSRKVKQIEKVILAPQVDDKLFSVVEVPKDTLVFVFDRDGEGIGDFRQPSTGNLELSPERLHAMRDEAETKEDDHYNPNDPTAADRKQWIDAALKVLRCDPPASQDARVEAALQILRNYHITDTNSQKWAWAIRELITIGKPAVPTLIEELDRVDHAANRGDELRALGFILRGIGDHRAIPALIRAIPALIRALPSTRQLEGIDYPLFVGNRELRKFMQLHAKDPTDRGTCFVIGRPINEVLAALQHLTNVKGITPEKQDEQAFANIYHIFLSGDQGANKDNQKLFLQLAECWAKWWAKNWKLFVNSEDEAQLERIHDALQQVSKSMASRQTAEITKPRIAAKATAGIDAKATKKANNARLLAVRVLDPQGKPLPDAKVHVGIWTKEKDFSINRDYRTDAAGLALVKLPETYYMAHLWTSKKPYTTMFSHWEQSELASGARLPDEYTIQLERTTTAGGRIVDEQGKPIAGAKVDVTATHNSRPNKADVHTEYDRLLTFEKATVTTDADGHWKIDDVPENPKVGIELVVSHPDYISDRLSGRVQEESGVSSTMLRQGTAVIKLKRCCFLQGRVLDPSGKPIQDASIVCTSDEFVLCNSCVLSHMTPDSVSTDADGRFRLRLSQHDLPTLIVVAPGWAPKFHKIEANRSMSPLELRMTPGKTVEVRFVDSAGKPVPNAAVLIGKVEGNLWVLPKPDNALDSKIAGKTDSNGIWRWTSAPDGIMKCGVCCEGFAPATFEISGNNPRRTITLKPEHRITGRVTDAVTGKPLPRFTVIPMNVFARDLPHAERQRAQLGKDGQFDYLAERTDIRQRLRVEATGYRTQTGPEFQTGDDSPRTQDFAMQPSLPITGTILDPSGKPAQKVDVFLATSTEEVRAEEDPSGNHNSTTDAAGRFEFPDPGEHFAVVVRADAGYAMAEFPVDKHEVGTIPLQPWASVHGQFRDGGKPIANAEVCLDLIRPIHLSRPIIQGRMSVRTDSEGRFAFSRVPPVDVNVSVPMNPWKDEGFRSAPSTPVSLYPGHKAEISLGGKGATINGRGRLVGNVPPGLDFTYSVSTLVSLASRFAAQPRLSNHDRSDIGTLLKKQDVFVPSLQRWSVKIAPDGTFRISGVPPGDYDLTIEVYAKPNGCRAEQLSRRTVLVVVTDASVARGDVTLPEIPLEIMRVPAAVDKITAKPAEKKAEAVKKTEPEPTLKPTPSTTSDTKVPEKSLGTAQTPVSHATNDLIEGVVVDEKGRGEAGVTVRLLTHEDKGQPSVQTDAQGRFQFHVNVQRRSLTILARTADGDRQGYYQFPYDCNPVRTSWPAARLTMSKPRVIEVLVVDGDRKPVADARVGAVASYEEIDGGRSDQQGNCVLRIPVGATLQSIYAFKSKQGLDYVAFPPKDMASHDGDPSSTSIVSPRPVLTLAGAKTVRIKLVDPQGRPVAGMWLYPWLFDKQTTYSKHWMTLNIAGVAAFHAKTDVDGVAVFDWLPAWNAQGITFWPKRSDSRYVHERITFDSKSGKDELTVQLVHTVPLRGRLQFADGRPAAGIQVSADGAGYNTDGFHESTKTNADGRFEFHANPEQLYMVAVDDSKWAAAARMGIVVHTDTPVDNVDFRLQPATTIRGRVTLGPDNKPLAKQNMMLLQNGSNNLDPAIKGKLPNPANSNHCVQTQMVRWASTDEQGNYAFFVGPGKYVLRGPDNSPNREFSITAEKSLSFDFHAPRPDRGLISGRVVLQQDKTQPVADAEIVGITRVMSSHADLAVAADRQGRFRAERWLDKMLLHATSKDGKLAGMIEITGDDKDVTIPLQPTTSAEGRLLDEKSGKPLRNREIQYGVRIYDLKSDGTPSGCSSSRFGGTVRTDSDGRFKVAGLMIDAKYDFDVPDQEGEQPEGRTWQQAGNVTVKNADAIQLGDLKLRPPYHAPTLQEQIDKKFDDSTALDAKLDLALKDAQSAMQRVLIVFADPASDACRQFYLLHFENENCQKAFADYRLVAVNSKRNKAADAASLLKSRFGVQTADSKQPVLLVVDTNGKLLASEGTQGISTSGKIDPKPLVAFLTSHAPDQPDAKRLLADAMAQADQENKRILIEETGAYCGWCVRLARFLESQHEILNPNYVIVKIDRWRFKNGETVIKRIRGDNGSIPWMAILDAKGKPLITSDSPKGNIGYPTKPEEIEHFLKMLRTTAQQITPEQLSALQKSLETSIQKPKAKPAEKKKEAAKKTEPEPTLKPTNSTTSDTKTPEAKPR